MNNAEKTIALAVLSVGLSIHSFARPAEPPATKPAIEDADKPKPATDAPVAAPAQAGENPAAATATPAPATPNDGLLRLNFRSASLENVLNYMSEAAGYIINVKPGTSIRGKVDVWSSQPLTKEEALNLLDTVLTQNGLAAIRTEQTLTIVSRDEAKTQTVPVKQGGEPDTIPVNDQIVTQIIPLLFVEVGQLLKDLQPLVSLQTTMTANEAGNALGLTDTQTTIHQVA